MCILYMDKPPTKFLPNSVWSYVLLYRHKPGASSAWCGNYHQRHQQQRSSEINWNLWTIWSNFQYYLNKLRLSVHAREGYRVEGRAACGASPAWWAWQRAHGTSWLWIAFVERSAPWQPRDGCHWRPIKFSWKKEKKEKRCLGGSCVSLLNIKQLNQKSEGLLLLGV